MKSRQTFLVAIFIVFSLLSLKAQTDTVMYQSPQTADSTSVKMNIIKLNLTSLMVKNISVQYERVINKFLSVTFSVRYMPNTTVPYLNFAYNKFGDDDPATSDAIQGVKMTNFSFSPEVRFYVGKKGYGRGFYVAPAYRYTQYKISNLNFVYANYPSLDSTISFSGSLNAHYGGVLLGAQWLLGKHLTLDWWFFGPLIGIEKSTINGVSSVPLSEDDQNDLRQNLEELDIPHTQKTVMVNEHGGSLKMKGLMAGMSFGLALGVRF